MSQASLPDPREGEPSARAREAGARFARLVDVVAMLRAPDGCPWDREQTLASLRPFVLEEAYEVLEAIDARNPAALGTEIGDFLFEGVLLAQLGAEAGDGRGGAGRRRLSICLAALRGLDGSSLLVPARTSTCG